MSRLIPKDSTLSLKRINPSTDQFSSSRIDGSELQMLFTPKAASIRRISFVEPCCVPTFMSAARRVLTPDWCSL